MYYQIFYIRKILSLKLIHFKYKGSYYFHKKHSVKIKNFTIFTLYKKEKILNQPIKNRQ